MDIIRNKKLNIPFNVLCAMALCVLVAIGIFVYKANVPGLLIYIAFAVFYVQLPGLLILKLMGLKLEHISTTVITGFFTGWAFVVLQYFLSDLLSTDILLYGLGPACSILYVVLVATGKGERICANKFSFRMLSMAFCAFVVIALFNAMLTTQYLYMAPSECDFTYMNPDKAYHYGLIDSLSHGYPLESPWVQGRTINYHIFTEVLYSVPVRLFGVTADVAIFTFGPIMTVYVLGLSAYSFFREMLVRNKYAGVACLILMLSNIYLTRGITKSIAFHFALTNENALGYGVAGAMMIVVLFKIWYRKYENGDKALRELILLTAIVMLTTGIKGPIGVVLLAAMWGTFIVGLIMRKASLKTALPLLIITAGFLLVYVTILGSKGGSNAGGGSIFAFVTIANIAFWKPAAIAFMKSLGLPQIVRYGVVLVLFMIFMLTAYILPFTIGYIRELILVFSKKKDYDMTRVIVYAAFLIGLIAMFFLSYGGHSQIYFGFVSVFFAPLIAYWFFEDMEPNKGKLMTAVRIIFVICLILTTITLVAHNKSMVDGAIKSTNKHVVTDTYLSISNAEYEGMMWLEENSPKDSLLATDRYSSVPMEDYDYQNRWCSRYFLYAAYSNRFCYIAGSGYNLPADGWVIRKEMTETNNKLYDPNYEGREELAKELGIDYVVVSKRFTGNPDLANNVYVKCFENEDLIIYELKY